MYGGRDWGLFFGVLDYFTFILGLSGSNGVLLFVPRLYLSLGLAGTNGINWVCVLYFPGQSDISYVFYG